MSLIEHTQTHENEDFIRGWHLSDKSICDDIINYFENDDDKHQGTTISGCDENVKISTDVLLKQSDVSDKYLSLLTQVVNEYAEIYPMVNYYSPWNLIENINIQKYNPTEAYFGWHTERSSGIDINASRHMVFMTYLNDVNDDGETEFYHQKLKIKPEKGLTLIWPADWTFTHRGCPSPSETKYIITGWLNYTK